MAGEMPDFRALIAIVADGRSLNVAQARAAFDVMMSGDATPSQMGAFLMALRVRGETVDEITGGVMTMREKMIPITAPPDAVDIVGTGGDGKGTVNISTATAIVVAGCGVPVAKHGNRAASSKTGTTDVQSALGINVEADFALFHGGAKTPRRHAQRRADAGRNGHPHDLQYSGAPVQSGGREAAIDRRL